MKKHTSNEKAIAALRKAEQSPAWKRAAAYVIIAGIRNMDMINDDNTLKYSAIGKIKVIYPADGMGTLKVFVWDCIGTELQMGSASGCGYDKLSAAMSGIVFDGIELTDHPKNWEIQLREAGYTVIQAL